MKNVFILDAIRTPIGSFGGNLSNLSAIQLGAELVTGILSRNNLNKNDIDTLIFGNVLSANLGQNPAKQIAIKGGLNNNTISFSVNKVCASGLKAVDLAAQSIALGKSNMIIAGGAESMSNAPYYLARLNQAKKMGNQQLIDGMFFDGLTDAYNGNLMGQCAELCATQYEISREDQDQWAIFSYKKALHANENDLFKNEIFPLSISTKGKTVVIDKDEEPYLANFEKLLQLKPAFDKQGTITAANASKLSDGAAALLLVTEDNLNQYSTKPLARIVDFADAEKEPNEFTTAPALAVEKLLQQNKLTPSDISFWEFNEAFAVVALANQKILNLQSENINIHGGAVALGHPLGCSGARILVSLCNILKIHQGKYGIAAICNGGGGASAVLIENVL